jgi:ParB-like chromosome segregation protein Spo0J
MRVHPYADLFPLLDTERLKQLADDIALNGLQQPIWTFEGQILDGRNRWAACQIVNVECRTVEYTGDDPLGFVISLNLHRRQLSASQLAMLGVEVEAMRAKCSEKTKSERCKAAARNRTRKNGIANDPNAVQAPQKAGEHNRDAESARQAAKIVGVNHDYISKAKRISRTAPELVAAVKDGKLNLNDAAFLARLPREQRNNILSNRSNYSGVKFVVARMRNAQLNILTSESQLNPRDVNVDLENLRRCFALVRERILLRCNGNVGVLIDCLREMQNELG